MPQNVKTARKSITRATISNGISEAVSSLSSKEAANFVEQIIDVMRNTLAEGEDIKISGFGKFVTHDKNSRRGRNPQTGEAIMISARRVIKFRPSDVLREELNDSLLMQLGDTDE